MPRRFLSTLSVCALSFQIALPALYSLTLPVIAHFTLGFVFGPGSEDSNFRRRLDATLTATWAYW